MEKFLQAGTAAVLACSLVALSTGCIAAQTTPSQDQERLKFLVAAQCVRALVDSFEQPPEIIVRIVESTSSPSVVSPPDWFLREVDRHNVRLGGTADAGAGTSMVAIYLNRIDVSSDGRRIASFTEVHSLSEKFLHEFSVSLDQGRIKQVSLERSLEL